MWLLDRVCMIRTLVLTTRSDKVSDGAAMSQILQGVRNCIWGSGLALALLIPSGAARAHSFSVLYSFLGGSDGAAPDGNLAKDSAGNLYGATSYGGGGSGSGCIDLYGGCGTIFKLTSGGAESLLYAFAGESDGGNPFGGVIPGAKGYLVGTALKGGADGFGTFFQLAPDGTLDVLHAFAGATSDGTSPASAPLKAPHGTYYGTTEVGGTGACHINPVGCGTVYMIDKAGTEKVVYFFGGGSDGAFPYGTPVADTAGNLYGTTDEGGGAGCSHQGVGGCGTIYEVAPNGGETVLYAFTGGSDGAYPQSNLIVDGTGNLYGTATSGGTDDFGTLFKLAPDGTFSVLHSFTGGSDGGDPGGLIADSKGNLYGTTFVGGHLHDCAGEGCGIVFKLASDGTETVLYAFTGGSDGSNPEGNLLRASGGYLYGMTLAGGNLSDCDGGGCGVIFKVRD
jgi:uncharacterized repeat protein (TIGR03803 family)